MFASLIAVSLVPLLGTQLAFAADCTGTGYNDEDRCYAVKEFFLDVEPLTVNVDLMADDVNVQWG